ncbi:hypothetical protein RE9425_42020 [Prescottella equi]|nr:hypothetical protein RE9425_42020 [Prescottella equi]BCN85520.1 hypothetical protein RE0356_41610 [Prescottella equi]
MSDGSTRTLSGTTFDTEPADRRSNAVVRADTGKLNTMSPTPSTRDRYAAKPATITGTSGIAEPLPLPVRVPAGSSPGDRSAGVVTGPGRSAIETDGGRSSRRSRQYSRSEASLVLPL